MSKRRSAASTGRSQSAGQVGRLEDLGRRSQSNRFHSAETDSGQMVSQDLTLLALLRGQVLQSLANALTQYSRQQVADNRVLLSNLASSGASIGQDSTRLLHLYRELQDGAGSVVTGAPAAGQSGSFGALLGHIPAADTLVYGYHQDQSATVVAQSIGEALRTNQPPQLWMHPVPSNQAASPLAAPQAEMVAQICAQLQQILHSLVVAATSSPHPVGPSAAIADAALNRTPAAVAIPATSPSTLVDLLTAGSGRVSVEKKSVDTTTSIQQGEASSSVFPKAVPRRSEASSPPQSAVKSSGRHVSPVSSPIASCPPKKRHRQSPLSLSKTSSKKRKDGKATSARQKRETFPETLYRLLKEVVTEGIQDVVSFTEDGRAFRIHRPRAFAKDVIPRYFQHNKLSSFKRQLGNYGFDRIPRGPHEGAFEHKNFRRDRPDLVKKIKSGTKPSSEWKPDFQSMVPDFVEFVKPTTDKLP